MKDNFIISDGSKRLIVNSLVKWDSLLMRTHTVISYFNRLCTDYMKLCYLRKLTK